MRYLKTMRTVPMLMRKIVVIDIDTDGILGSGLHYQSLDQYQKVITELFDLKGNPLPEGMYKLAMTDDKGRIVHLSTQVQ